MIAVLIAIIVFCVHEQELPASWVESLCREHVSSKLKFRCGGASFKLTRGFRIRDFAVYDPDSAAPERPVLSFSEAVVLPFLHRLTLIDLQVPRLHDGYYAATATAPLRPGELKFPGDYVARIELVRPRVLGIAADHALVSVHMLPTRLEFNEGEVSWNHRESPGFVEGACTIDAEKMLVSGHVAGTAVPADIRPLLEVLDLPDSLPYFDNFTGVKGAVPAQCSWLTDLTVPNFKLELSLKAELGCYNGVPLKYVDGRLAIDNAFGEQVHGYHVEIGPLVSEDRRGGRLEGEMSVSGTGTVTRLTFDAAGSLPLKDTLDIIGYFNDGMFDFLECETAPRVSVKGDFFPEPEQSALNDLHGDFAFDRGAVCGIPLSEASGEFALTGAVFAVTNVTATGKYGGHFAFSGETVLTDVDSNGQFRVHLDCRDGTIVELEDIRGVELGERYGDLSGDIELTGCLAATNLYERLNGRGSIKIRNGHLAQMNLFLGLTKMLAEYVPGVSLMVNQSQGSVDFTIANGVVKTENLLIEGNLFSIKADGTYDLVHDRLDFRLQVRFMKDESYVGKFLVRPITWIFTKSLLEFHLGGSLAEPEWSYITLLDKVL